MRGTRRRFSFSCRLPFTAGVSLRWHVVSGICWFCITSFFTSHWEIKQLPSCLLITAVWMDYFVSITLRPKTGIPSPFFNLSGSIFQFQSDHLCLWLQRYMPSPLLLSDLVWVEPSQGSTQELCSKECFQIPEDCEFFVMVFFPCCSNSRHNPH